MYTIYNISIQIHNSPWCWCVGEKKCMFELHFSLIGQKNLGESRGSNAFYTVNHDYQLIGSFTPTVPILSFPSVLQKRATGSVPCPSEPHDCRNGKTGVGCLWFESPPSVSAIAWAFVAALLLNASNELGSSTLALLEVMLLLLVKEFKTVSVMLLLVAIPRRQGEGRVLAGAWGGSTLLPRRWVRSWCCSRLSVQSSCGWRWIFMWALRDLIL